MANQIVRPFSLLHDFRSVAWKPTLLYNLMRSLSAGIVMAVFMLCIGEAKKNGIGMVLAIPLLWPIAYLLFFFPMSLILGIVTEFLPVVGLLQLIFALMAVTLGDPLICILYAIYPRAVPVNRPAFLCFALMVWVFKADETVENVVVGAVPVQKEL